MKQKAARLLAVVAGLSAGAVITVASAQTSVPVHKARHVPMPATAEITVNPAAMIRKATAAVPPNATKTTTVGKGALQVSTANNPSDTDSCWVDKFDMDGDGTVDETAMVWDDEDKVLYAYSDGAFACKDGTTGTGGMMVGVNAAGNPRNRPAGSGFWVAEVDKGECGAAVASIFGCRFNASGKSTDCGNVTLDEKNDDIVIVQAQK